MSTEEQRRYWPQFSAARDKLLARIRNEAPPALRPLAPANSGPELTKWRDSVPSVLDPLSPDYDPFIVDSPWLKVKDAN